jgi:hypothetical protein
MAFSVRILPGQRLDIIRYSGDVTRADFDAVWRSLLESEEWSPDFDEVAVFAPDADVADLNFESVNDEARRFKTTYEQARIDRARRTAIVVSNQMQMLNARMFLAYIATNPPPNIEFKLFNKVSSGIDWIEQGRQGKLAPIDRPEVQRVIDELEHMRRLESGKGACAKAG